MQVLNSQFVYSKGSDSANGSKNNKALGKDAFLTMLVAQMKNQDPMKPMDNTEFTAQLAQFSSLEQMFNVNENLKNIQMTQSSLNNTQSVSIIGKVIKAEGNSVKLSAGTPVDINYKLSSAAKDVKINIYDSRGELVRAVSTSSQDAGEHSFVWDGKDGSGNSLSDGTYSFMVSAKDPAGTDVSVTPLIKGQVTGVSFDNGNTLLSVGGQRVSLGSVIEVNSMN
ncbi:MAG: flagellar hook assembly protein FlgD [Nitrospinae bacterium]|nr:flagellar hook assembly protein FlgD [Nitrospinota bacterium]